MSWWLVAVLLLAVAGVTAWEYYHYFPRQLGPAQPIAFSHRVHVTDKQLNCLFCHSGALDTPRATVPPLETCLLCHSRILTQYPEIVKLRQAYEAGRPVAWVRVNDLPDYVFFDHERHVRGGIDCGQCHGDVAAMDRVTSVQPFEMGFCVQCHRDRGYSHDCLVCHR